jgi:hypothetical protein
MKTTATPAAERITRVALLTKRDTAYSLPCPPNRHADVIMQMRDAGVSQLAIAEAQQGFMTNENRFVSRYDAVYIAEAAGQIVHPIPPSAPRQLYSENLFTEEKS